MKNILKLLSLVLMIPFLLNSCQEDNFRDWTTPKATFKLHDTTLGSNVLYPTMANNPFRLTWDAPSTVSSSFNVVFSTTTDFATKVSLGTVNTNTFTTTINTLNTALLQAGYSPYTMKKVYFRIEAGTDVSNVISLDVTPYPAVGPVITAPTTTTALTLDKATPDDNAAIVRWNDYSTYGVSVTYLVEVARTGTTDYIALGSVNNLRLLEVTHKTLNDAVLKVGLTPLVEGSVNIRVTATTRSQGGTINQVSNVVTFRVTPYVAYVNLFLVGDATAAGWNPDNNNQALFRDPSVTSKFYFTGKFGTSMFKLLEVLGQWQPQWGVKGGTVANSDGGDPDPFTVSTAGYYTFTVDINAKTYSLVPFTGSTSTTYNTLGLIGSATSNGWGGDTFMTKSTFDPHLWVRKGVALTAGEVKFRANSDWGINWGANTEVSGQGTSGGPNIPVSEAGNYDVYFNDLDGRYLFIKR